MRYKGTELGKVKDVNKYKVYVHAQKNTFMFTKPSFASEGVTGDIVIIKDHVQAEEIKNPSTPSLLKKHKQDLNLFTKADNADSANNITLKKSEISEYSLVLVHSRINWGKIGNGIADVIGVAVCIGAIGALVYWFTLI